MNLTTDAHRDRMSAAVQAVETLNEAAQSLAGDAQGIAAIAAEAAPRGYFLPAESDSIRQWFARYLTVRGALHETLSDLRPIALRRARVSRGAEDFALAAAFTAACLLIRLARTLIWEVAPDDLTRRKLDEPDDEHRIPAGMFSSIYAAVLDPKTESAIAEGRDAIASRRSEVEAIAPPSLMALVDSAASAIDVHPDDLSVARSTHRRFRWFRIGRSVASAALFALAERSGRIIADLRWPWHRDRVGRIAQRRFAAMLQPGDVLITRHTRALSNLFLPGFWPHAALYVGDRASVEAMGVNLRPHCREHWRERDVVLEARKDGVRLRPLHDTLAVDSVLLLRPAIEPSQVPKALEQALRHEGKQYNFDFDFFTDDRLVCTEVVYRAFQGVGEMNIPLSSRYGRPTLSAEDLVSIGLAGTMFRIVAAFGIPGAKWIIARDERAVEVTRMLRESGAKPSDDR